MRSSNLRCTVITVLALAGVVASAQAWREAPAGIKECERDQGKIVCSTWVRTGDGYSATWPDGNVGQITLGLVDHLQGHFGDETIRYTFIREDQSGPTAGLKAIYECEIHKGKKVVSGWKVWKENGKEKSVRWTGVILGPGPVLGPEPGPEIGPRPGPGNGFVVPVSQGNAVAPPQPFFSMPANNPVPGAPPVAQPAASVPLTPRSTLAPAARPQTYVPVSPAPQPVAPAKPVFRILIPGRKPTPKPEERMPFDKWISCPEDHTC